MTAGHFAAALAIKGRAPKADTGWLIVGAFIPDFLWIVLATSGVEPTKREIFFDDWSHSLVSVVVLATLYAFFFRKSGRAVAWAMWAAVVSHFALDLPIHPKELALFPHSTAHLGLGLTAVPPMTYWSVQFAVVLCLLAIYVERTRHLHIAPRWIAASCVLVLGWHVVLLPG